MVINLKNKLLYDYINGEDIDNIDELENNYIFMMEVIKITKDKNIYNLCSDNVKKNYEFVKFIIDFFKSDKDFVEIVSKYYLDRTDECDVTYNELCFILCDIFNDPLDKRTKYYSKKRSNIYIYRKE